jgi:DNA-binding FadR family transcriptional regulator
LSHRYPGAGQHGRIVHTIGRRIVTGEILPGERLPTAAHVRASRGVVREAFKVLAAKGLVVSRTKTGTRVRPRESWNLLDPDVLAWRHLPEITDERHRQGMQHSDR